MSDERAQEALRALPQVDRLVRDIGELATVGPVVARWLVRREIDAARERVLAGADPGDIPAAVRSAVNGLSLARLRKVINATGVVLHTNLGRAPLDAAARDAILAAAGATPLEMDPVSGERAARAPVAPTLVAALLDTEDAMIVNNNAAALLLALGALARGGEVIVSRGELIEIGGAFRLPDVMAASGARLREVGTTNRTRLRDYTDAIDQRTRLILKVHPSNYRIVGFTEEPPLSDLVWAAREAGVPLLFDIGSGLLRPEEDALADEPDGATAIAAGCDLVCFSGDKLLGGPQAGVLAGRADLIERCRRDPVARAVRADKLSLAALEATLWAYARGEADGLPVRRMLAATREQLAARARALTDAVPEAEIIDGESVVGGGSVPGHALPTVLVSLRTDRPERLAAALRTQEPPVFARVEAGRVLIDLRTVHPTDDATLREALARAR